MSKGLGDIIYAAVKKAFGDEEGYDDLKKPYGLGDTIYTATRKAINNEDYDGSDSKPVGLGDTIYAAVKKASDELGGIGGGGGGIEWQHTTVENTMVWMDRYDEDLDGWRVGVYGLGIFSNVNAGDIIGVRFDNVLYPIAAGKIGSDFYGRVKTAISGESFELNLYLDNEIWDEDFVILIKQGTATKEQLQTWAARDHFLSIDYTSIASIA